MRDTLNHIWTMPAGDFVGMLAIGVVTYFLVCAIKDLLAHWRLRRFEKRAEEKMRNFRSSF